MTKRQEWFFFGAVFAFSIMLQAVVALNLLPLVD
jgi:hypothetical protein